MKSTGKSMKIKRLINDSNQLQQMPNSTFIKQNVFYAEIRPFPGPTHFIDLLTFAPQGSTPDKGPFFRFHGYLCFNNSLNSSTSCYSFSLGSKDRTSRIIMLLLPYWIFMEINFLASDAWKNKSNN